MDKYKLLELSGRLVKAIDDCNGWFVMSRWERDPVKKAVYNAVYEAKNKEYLQVLQEVHEKLA